MYVCVCVKISSYNVYAHAKHPLRAKIWCWGVGIVGFVSCFVGFRSLEVTHGLCERVGAKGG